ncbi:chromosome partitioning protein ParA [Caballeronia zhejiangensis]|uniref:Chromosome partitioning protein ParA n=2 Tax=Caballeronia zhejiangensis TaxID=871203 RepID=A0A656QFZ1_9BURK|nr:chromosome partitioning protein ParA [Caballeronia zhejiangensis]
MSVCVIGAEKGGVGKSTLTENAAAIRAEVGYRVVIADFDNQGTCSKWISRREEHPDLAKIAVRRLRKEDRGNLRAFGELVQELVDSYDDVLIDVGGQDTGIFRAALAVADKVIVPLTPSPDDLDTVPDLADIVRRFDKPLDIRIVLNMTSGQPTMLKSMKKGLEGFSDVLPLMPKMIGTRVAFKYAKNKGQGVAELSKADGYDPHAANEMKDFYLGVFGK